VLESLRVLPAAMRRNLDLGGGVVFSQGVLLALVEAGLARDEAYAIVQRHALAAVDGGVPFRAALEADPVVRERLTPERLARCFDLDGFLGRIGAIYARATPPRALEAGLPEAAR